METQKLNCDSASSSVWQAYHSSFSWACLTRPALGHSVTEWGDIPAYLVTLRMGAADQWVDVTSVPRACGAPRTPTHPPHGSRASVECPDPCLRPGYTLPRTACSQKLPGSFEPQRCSLKENKPSQGCSMSVGISCFPYKNEQPFSAHLARTHRCLFRT